MLTMLQQWSGNVQQWLQQHARSVPLASGAEQKALFTAVAGTSASIACALIHDNDPPCAHEVYLQQCALRPDQHLCMCCIVVPGCLSTVC